MVSKVVGLRFSFREKKKRKEKHLVKMIKINSFLIGIQNAGWLTASLNQNSTILRPLLLEIMLSVYFLPVAS